VQADYEDSERRMDDPAASTPSQQDRTKPGALRGCGRVLGCGLILLSLVVLASAMAFVWPYLVRDRLQIENYDKIRTGMSMKEVEELLGGPAGGYGTRASPHGAIGVAGPELIDRCWCWTSPDVEIEVCFYHDKADGQDKVSTSYGFMRKPRVSLTDRVLFPFDYWRRRLGG
jgi:hypothetical protein